MPAIYSARQRWPRRSDDSVWVGDHLLWHVSSPDPAVLLGALAARTARIRLGTAVLLAALRPPVLVAKMAATLDHLAEGRFILGVGIGGENPAEFEATGVPLHERSARLDETLAICRSLWDSDGNPVSHDGWLAFVVTPERFAEGWATVRRHAAGAGRDPGALTPGLQVWCNLADSDEEARARLVPRIEAMYRAPYERFARSTICGTAETWQARIAEFVVAGVRHFNLVFASGNVPAQIARFAAEVRPGVSPE
jgi:alkanesulfonate monooxygenase SsuD/methylene tetrahydromethanopterin reductase-like flavin-dependent oxidoreductase (luciferase family)